MRYCRAEALSLSARAIMGEQRTFAGEAWSAKPKITKRERFLAEMNAVVPWAALLARIAPHYPKGERGRPPIPLERMLRIYFLQQWFNLSDPAAEEALYDSEAMRRFVGVELGDDAMPDETTILHFRHLLERHELTEQLFVAVRELLTAKGLLLTSGTIVDATILHAPSSTKNATKTRDPEMKQTRKGQQWHFGMKAHVGTDTRGVVHSLVTTDAAQADVTQLPHLLHGGECVLYGDKGYWKQEDRRLCEAAGVRYRVNRRGTEEHPATTAYWKRVNLARSRIRARVEHAFGVVKHLWKHTKVRYRGLAKNTTQLFTLFALANLYLLRDRLGARRATCLR
jgi:IS5 family transposase